MKRILKAIVYFILDIFHRKKIKKHDNRRV